MADKMEEKTPSTFSAEKQPYVIQVSGFTLETMDESAGVIKDWVIYNESVS